MVANKFCQDLLTDLALSELSTERDEPKKRAQHELSLAENFSKPIGLKRFHHGIPEQEKAQLHKYCNMASESEAFTSW